VADEHREVEGTHITSRDRDDDPGCRGRRSGDRNAALHAERSRRRSFLARADEHDVSGGRSRARSRARHCDHDADFYYRSAAPAAPVGADGSGHGNHADVQPYADVQPPTGTLFERDAHHYGDDWSQRAARFPYPAYTRAV
jgi:hypothetical protein